MSEDLRAFAPGGGQAIIRRAEMSRSQNSSDKAFSNPPIWSPACPFLSLIKLVRRNIAIDESHTL